MLPLAVRALLLVILALVPAALVHTMLEREAREDRRTQLANQASQFARLVASQQSRTLEGVRNLLIAVAAHEAISAARPGAVCDAYLARVLEGYSHVIALGSFDTGGRLICGDAPRPPGLNIAGRPYVQAVLAGSDFAVGQLTQGLATGQRTLHLAVPLRDAGDAVLGGLVAALSIDWLNADLAELRLPAGASAAILDRDGIVLARTPEPEPFIGARAPAFALPAITSGQPAIIEGAALDGPRRILGLMPVGGTPAGLTVAVGLSVELGVLDELKRERRTSLLVVGALMAGLLLAIAAFQVGVDKPVQKLMHAAQAWSAQNWTARVGRVGGGREFDRIATALDAMAEALQRAELARLAASARVKALSDVSPQVVFTADATGRIDWVNGYWRQFTGLSLDRSVGVGLMRAIHHKDRRAVLDAWRAATTPGAEGELNLEVRICEVKAHAWRWFYCRAAPIRDEEGLIVSWAGVALDFHDLRQAREALAEQSERLRVTYQTAPIGLCLLDPELRFLAINAVLADAHGASAEAHLGHVLGEMAPEASLVLEEPLHRLFRTGEAVVEMEVRGPPVAPPAPRRVWLCNFLPVRNAEGLVVAATGSVLDITARKHAEITERLLSREVDHRAKNVLAVVRSMVRVSAAEAPSDVEGFVEVLEGRIAAMARVHTLLSRASWNSVELADLVREETAAHAGQFRTTGGFVRLVPEAAQPLTMVLHELVTNSAKYGALSERAGTVTLSWTRQGDGVVLEWLERGGPALSGPPTLTGLGTELIDGNAGTPLDGGIERRWEPQGLRGTLRIGPGALLGPDQAA